jgi:hypothetical protein
VVGAPDLAYRLHGQHLLAVPPLSQVLS